MILYIDTFISETALSPNKTLQNLLSKVQNSSYTYRRQSKVDILKYSIASYACINWEKIVIRVDGEDSKKLSSLTPYIEEIFPQAKLEFERSDTGLKFAKTLSKIDSSNKNPWIFFSPNNDHPFIGDNPEFFKELINDAEKAENNYNLPVSIVYSHYTESINSIKNNSFLYGCHGDFCEILDESDFSYTVKFRHLSLFSLQIYRSSFLSKLMILADKSRVVRTECLGPFVDYKQSSIQIVPKTELCRHYDGYLHTYSFLKDYIKASICPPLFIPDGFFEKDIKIKYGYDKYFEGYLNINPNKKNYIFENSNGTDVAINKNNLPFFWLYHIKSIDSNPSFTVLPTKDQILIRDIENPWRNYSRLYIKFVICCRVIYYFFRLYILKKHIIKYFRFFYKFLFPSRR